MTDCQCSPDCAEPCRDDRSCTDTACRCYQNWSMEVDLSATPDEQLDLSSEVIAPGKQVVVLPCTNPAMGPTLEIIGWPRWFWSLKITDAFGTVLWEQKLSGREGAIHELSG